MEKFNVQLSNQDLNQISVALTLYLSEMRKCGIKDSMLQNTISLFEFINSIK